MNTATDFVETRKIFHYGVSVNSLTYNSRELHDLYRRKGRIEVTIRWDRSDLGYIFVLDKIMGRNLKVPCTWFEYASGVSLWLHKKIWQEAENRDEGYSEAKLEAAKARIRAICQKTISARS